MGGMHGDEPARTAPMAQHFVMHMAFWEASLITASLHTNTHRPGNTKFSSSGILKDYFLWCLRVCPATIIFPPV